MKKYLGILFLASLMFLPFVSKANITSDDVSVTKLSSSITKTIPVNGNDPLLKADFKVRVTANSRDIYLPKDGSFSSFFVKSGTYRQTPTNCVRTFTTNPNIQITSDSAGNYFYKLRSGTSADFQLSLSCKISQMFAGSYYGKISALIYAFVPEFKKLTNKELDLRTTYTSIVGETSPWLSSVISTKIDGVKDGYSIMGERLLGVSVYVNNVKVTPVNVSAGQISIGDLVLPTGYYPLYVQNAKGKSNLLSIYVYTPTGTPVVNVKSSRIYQEGGVEPNFGSLKAEFSVEVTARGGDIYIAPGNPNPLKSNFYFKSANSQYTSELCRYSSSPAQSLPTVSDKYGNTLYVVSQDRTVVFNSYAACPVNQMTSGIYYAKLSGLLYKTRLTDNSFTNWLFDSKTNDLTIRTIASSVSVEDDNTVNQLASLISALEALIAKLK